MSKSKKLAVVAVGVFLLAIIYAALKYPEFKKKAQEGELMRVSEEDLMDQFSQAIEEIDILPDFANQLLGALNEAKEKARRAIKQDISNYSSALKTLEGAEDDLYKDLKRGILDEESYHR